MKPKSPGLSRRDKWPTPSLADLADADVRAVGVSSMAGPGLRRSRRAFPRVYPCSTAWACRWPSLHRSDQACVASQLVAIAVTLGAAAATQAKLLRGSCLVAGTEVILSLVGVTLFEDPSLPHWTTSDSARFSHVGNMEPAPMYRSCQLSASVSRCGVCRPQPPVSARSK
jgi:hypothetical protein